MIKRTFMTVLRKIFGTSIAIAVALTVSAPSSAFAQAGGSVPAAPAQGGPGVGAGVGGRAGGRGGRRGGPRYTPAPGAKDLKAVLFNWAWYMGMLRSSEERDLIMSLEYQGKGTMQVDGQPCNVTKYRTSISYQTSGERIQIHRHSAQWPERAPMSKSSVERMPGTKTFPAPNSSPVKARRRRCPQL